MLCKICHNGCNDPGVCASVSIEGGEAVADFERLYREHYKLVYQVLLGLSRDPGLSEELAQETFFRAYINLAKLRSDAAATVWLCRIARNLYFAWCREQKRLRPPEEAVAGDMEERVVEKMLSEQASAELERLEEPYRQVFTLHVLGGVPLKEISRLFGKSESWARVTYYRAKNRIAERMGENGM